MVLVSYPEVINPGVNSGPNVESINEPLSSDSSVFSTMGVGDTGLGQLGDYIDGKIPNVLALATAFTRLLTPNLPLIFRV